jgi:hypothetical protein
MRGIIGGQRPDLTPAQVVAGVPVLANLLHVFGVFSLDAAQTDSLEKTIGYGMALVAGDAAVRIGRNLKDARVEATAIGMPGEPTAKTPGLEAEHVNLMDADQDLDDGLDDDEFDDDDLVTVPPDADVLEDDRVADELEAEPLPEPTEIRPGGERPERPS